MSEVALVLLPWSVTTFVIYALITWDEHDLTPTEHARARPIATKRSAVFVFTLFALSIRCWRTRRGALGAALALVGLVESAALDVIVSELTARAFGVR